MFQPLSLVYRRDNFMYHHWDKQVIHRGEGGDYGLVIPLALNFFLLAKIPSQDTGRLIDVQYVHPQ